MMDRLILSQIDEGLELSEVTALCFLCCDVVSRRRLEGIRDAKELFWRLEEKGLLQNDAFLKQLLHTIRRVDLLKILETDSRPLEETDASPVLSDYRKMLYDLYQDFTQENFQMLKFLLSDRLDRRQIEMCKTALDVFAEMEKKDLISDTNVNVLYEILQRFDQELATIVQKYIQRIPQQQQHLILSPHVSMGDLRTPEPTAVLSITETQPSREIIHTDAQINTELPSPPDQSEYYALTRNPRGLCMVFNNEDFTGTGLKNRGGTQKDVDALKTVFTSLGFKVVIHNNLTAAYMLKELRMLGRKNFVNHDALVVCMLSHGDKGCVFGTDEKPVYLKEMTEPFTSGAAPTLAGKPKLYFIQACQGDGYQKGFYPYSLSPGEGERENHGMLESDAGRVYDEAVPSQADFLIGMATVEECKSFRNTATGSIYIQELCRQLTRSAESREMDDILTVLTRVNREVSKGDYLSHKQMPEPKYTLTKKLVLKFV